MRRTTIEKWQVSTGKASRTLMRHGARRSSVARGGQLAVKRMQYHGRSFALARWRKLADSENCRLRDGAHGKLGICLTFVIHELDFKHTVSQALDDSANLSAH